MPPALRALCLFALLYLGPVAAPNGPARLGPIATAAAQENGKVWVNTRSGVYHCPGTRYYGNTKAGQFMSEGEARAAGNRPAYGQTCRPSSAAAVSPQLSTAALASEASPRIKVWVNTRSGVYHCPGTRYYGNTKSGQFMSETAARTAGNRPAYGRRAVSRVLPGDGAVHRRLWSAGAVPTSLDDGASREDRRACYGDYSHARCSGRHTGARQRFRDRADGRRRQQLARAQRGEQGCHTISQRRALRLGTVPGRRLVGGYRPTEISGLRSPYAHDSHGSAGPWG